MSRQVLFILSFAALVLDCFVEGCREYFNGSMNTITSPQPFLGNMQCEWTIEVAKGRRVALFLNSIDFGQDTDCRSTYIEVRDGAPPDPTLHGRYCDPDHPPVLVSSGRLMTIFLNLQSETAPSGKGFNATFYSTLIGCESGLTLTEPKGSLASSNFPNSYPGDMPCIWTITTAEGTKITLYFTIFDVAGDLSCRYHSVKVYDAFKQDQTLLGDFCNSQHPKDTRIESSGNKMEIVFDSGRSDSGHLDSGHTDSGRRFHAVYFSTVVSCGHLVNPENGQVRNTSGNPPFYNSSVIFTCNDGYNLEGYRVRLCQGNGQWSGVSPSCLSVNDSGSNKSRIIHMEGLSRHAKWGISLGVTGLTFISIIACVCFKYRKERAEPVDMYDNPQYDTTVNVISLSPSAVELAVGSATGNDAPEEMEITENLCYDSVEAFRK